MIVCIGSERNPMTHNRMKKSLVAAFSTSTWTDRERIVQNCVNGFIGELGEKGTEALGLDMTEWFSMIALHILEEMAFGESFQCIEKGQTTSFAPLRFGNVLFN